MSNQGRFRERGFTVIEGVIVAITIMVLIAMLLPALGGRRPAHQMRDSSQIRGIHQSLVQWSLQNQDQFPLPSQLDPMGTTVNVGQLDDPTQAFKLDSTRNIFSLLVFNGSVPVYMMVSPAEQGPIIEYENYQVTEPLGAVEPEKALWDPTFRATPRDSAIGEHSEALEGSFSYAHAIPFGARRASAWRDDSSGDRAVLGNRGASWAQARNDEWVLLDGSHTVAPDYSTPVGKRSNTLLIHGSRLKWEGNIAYQDNRVIFETRPDPEDLPFTFAGLGVRADNLFVNEDDASGVADAEGRVNAESDNVNAFLRSYSDRISGSVLDDAGGGVLDVALEVFYD